MTRNGSTASAEQYAALAGTDDPRRVVLLSPWRPRPYEPYAKYEDYLRDCLRDSVLNHGETPYASHAMLAYTEALDDDDPEEREIGMACEDPWLRVADYVVCYVDHGISAGMRRSIEHAERIGIRVVRRRLGD